MHTPVLEPNGSSVMKVGERVSKCVAEGCGGVVVRHSLGGGQAVYRCARCFRRYQFTPAASAGPEPQSRLRRFINDFVSWRD
jgi:hypothetical protein